MCEWCEVYQDYQNIMFYDLGGLSLGANVQQGQCRCGRILSYNEMHPANACTRSLCNVCYEKIFKRINYRCVSCGCDISHKIADQQHNWREIESHLCGSDLCRATWAYQHAVVLGVAQHRQSIPQQTKVPQPQYARPAHSTDGFLIEAARRYEQGAFPQYQPDTFSYPGIDPLPIPDSVGVEDRCAESDVIEGEFVEVGSSQRKSLPVPQRRRLPAPGVNMTFQSCFDQVDDRNYARDDDGVVVVDLTKRR